MGSFFSREDDEYKDDIKTAFTISLLEPENSEAREEIDEQNTATASELSLMENGKGKQEDQQITKTNKPKDKGKGKQEDEGKGKQEKDKPKDKGKSVIEGGKSFNPQGLCSQIGQEKQKPKDKGKGKQEQDKPKDKGKGKQEDADDHHEDK